MELFVSTYGSSEPSAVEAALKSKCMQFGLDYHVKLLKQDVAQLDGKQLRDQSKLPYHAVMVDCAKLPLVLQGVLDLLCDPQVVMQGTQVFFEDMFDFHAPWNLYALVVLIQRGNARIAARGKRVGLILEIVDFHSLKGVIQYDDPSPIQDQWAIRFTDVELELRALDQFKDMLQGCIELQWKVEALRIGALLRGQRVDEAYTLIMELDNSWPLYLDDALLQEAYIRLYHYKTKVKDKTLRTPNHPRRLLFRFRRLTNSLRYRVPVF